MCSEKIIQISWHFLGNHSNFMSGIKILFKNHGKKARKIIQISYMWISSEVRKNKGKDGHSEEEYIISVIYIYSLLYRILFQDMQVAKNLSSCRQARRRKLSDVKMLLLNDENYFS